MKEEAGSGGEPSDGGWDVDDDIELPPGLDNSEHYVSQAPCDHYLELDNNKDNKHSNEDKLTDTFLILFSPACVGLHPRKTLMPHNHSNVNKAYFNIIYLQI